MPTPVAAATLLDRARALHPLLDRMGPVSEAQCALAPEVVDALHTNGLFGMFTPRECGGAEITPTEALDVLDAISYADGSTGWVLMASALSIGTAAAFLDEDVVREMFGRDRFPVIAGQGAPLAKARRMNDGYMLSGEWGYGSGIKHADYLHNGAMVVGEDDKPLLGANGLPEARILVVPRAAFEYGDNWNVMGLRATGSIDYRCRGVFVPEGATHITECTTPKRGGPLLRLGIRGLSTIGHTGYTIGTGRRILAEVAAIARVKVGRYGLLGESERFLEEYGAAEAKFRAARALAYETWRDIEHTLYRGDALSKRQNTLFRLALNNITWSIADVARFAYFAAGGASLREGTLQRFFRDMHAATQHLTSAAPVLRDCGRELAGMAEDKVWGFSTLMDARKVI